MSNTNTATPAKSGPSSPTITPLHDPAHQAKVIKPAPLGTSNRESLNPRTALDFLSLLSDLARTDSSREQPHCPRAGYNRSSRIRSKGIAGKEDGQGKVSLVVSRNNFEDDDADAVANLQSPLPTNCSRLVLPNSALLSRSILLRESSDPVRLAEAHICSNKSIKPASLSQSFVAMRDSTGKPSS